MNLLLLAATVTTIIAGRPVPVTCGDTLGNSGWYQTARDAIVMNPIECALLGSTTDASRAHGLHTLIHEAEHAAGLMDEHAADCATVRAFPAVIRRLRWPARLAAISQRIHDSLPAPYSGAC